MKKPRIRTVTVALLVGGVAALSLPFFLTGGAIVYEAGGGYLARTFFNSAAWQDSARVFSQDPVRMRMIEDLLKRQKLSGMTRAQTVAILGEPDETPYFREWDMVYWLDPESGLIGLDSEWLLLRLDELQYVKEHTVVIH